MLYRDMLGEDKRPYFVPVPAGLALIREAIIMLRAKGSKDSSALALSAELSRAFGEVP